MSAYSDLIVAHGAIVYLRLGEFSGTAAVDAKGGTSWTYQNSPTLDVTGALTGSGDTDTAITLDGITSFKRARIDAVPLNATNNFTLECWVNPLAQNDSNGALIYCGTGANGYGLAVDGSNFLRGWSGGGGMTDAGASALTVGVWQHCVLKREAGVSSCWVNGVRIDPNTNNTGAPSAPTTISCVGCRNASDWFFKGSVDEVALYSTALSDAQIAAHYAAGVTGFAAAGTRITHARLFDGIDDDLQVSLGGLSGAWSGATIAAIFKPRAAGTAAAGTFFGIEGTLDLSAHRGNSVVDLYDYSTFQSWSSWSIPLDQWVFVAYTKPTGTTSPTVHAYYYSTGGWDHAVYGVAQPNLPSPSTPARFGTNQFGAFYPGLVACVGVWKSTALSDAQVETLPHRLANWNILAPSALWLFNQPSTASAVNDRIAGANQTSIVGTAATAVSDLPFDVGALAPTHHIAALG